jgi:hypothetical protein
MPVDPNASPKDKAKALAAIAFFVVAMIVIYILAQVTGGHPAAK